MVTRSARVRSHRRKADDEPSSSGPVTGRSQYHLESSNSGDPDALDSLSNFLMSHRPRSPRLPGGAGSKRIGKIADSKATVNTSVGRMASQAAHVTVACKDSIDSWRESVAQIDGVLSEPVHAMKPQSSYVPASLSQSSIKSNYGHFNTPRGNVTQEIGTLHENLPRLSRRFHDITPMETKQPVSSCSWSSVRYADQAAMPIRSDAARIGVRTHTQKNLRSP